MLTRPNEIAPFQIGLIYEKFRARAVKRAFAQRRLEHGGVVCLFLAPMSTEPAAAAAATPYSRKNPFPAPMLVNRKLTLEGSEKETRHFELSLEGSSLTYECGDSIGIFAKNDPELVEQILH